MTDPMFPDRESLRRSMDRGWQLVAEMFGIPELASKPETEPETESSNELRTQLSRLVHALLGENYDADRPTATQVDDAIHAFYKLRRRDEASRREADQHDAAIRRARTIIDRLQKDVGKKNDRIAGQNDQITALTEHVERLRWLESQRSALPADAVDLLWYAATQQPDTRPTEAVRARMQLVLDQWRRVPVLPADLAEALIDLETGNTVPADVVAADLRARTVRYAGYNFAAGPMVDVELPDGNVQESAVGHGTDDASHAGPLLASLPDDWPLQLEKLINTQDVKLIDWRGQLHDSVCSLVDDWVTDAERHGLTKSVHDALLRVTGAAREAEPCE